jgi:hypothetical protein
MRSKVDDGLKLMADVTSMKPVMTAIRNTSNNKIYINMKTAHLFDCYLYVFSDTDRYRRMQEAVAIIVQQCTLFTIRFWPPNCSRTGHESSKRTRKTKEKIKDPHLEGVGV